MWRSSFSGLARHVHRDQGREMERPGFPSQETLRAPTEIVEGDYVTVHFECENVRRGRLDA